MTTSSKFLIAITALAICYSAYAHSDTKSWYVSADVGVFQGNFDLIYKDMTDVIQQNIRQSVQQYGYTGGLALGYSHSFDKQYFVGAELNVNGATNLATFSSGTASLTDKIYIQDYVDLVLVPGIYLTDTLAAYLKAGVSYAQVHDKVSSPGGYNPTFVSHKNNNQLWGLAVGIGLKKFITEQWVIFAEYQYHDYQKANFPNFQNFTANYNHSANVYSQAVTLGASYFFK